MSINNNIGKHQIMSEAPAYEFIGNRSWTPSPGTIKEVTQDQIAEGVPSSHPLSEWPVPQPPLSTGPCSSTISPVRDTQPTSDWPSKHPAPDISVWTAQCSKTYVFCSGPDRVFLPLLVVFRTVLISGQPLWTLQVLSVHIGTQCVCTHTNTPLCKV